MNAIDEDDDDCDDENDDVDDVDDDVLAVGIVAIELNFCNKLLESDGALNNDVAVNNEFNNVDACKTDVDMVDATICGADVEGEPINGT